MNRSNNCQKSSAIELSFVRLSVKKTRNKAFIQPKPKMTCILRYVFVMSRMNDSCWRNSRM